MLFVIYFHLLAYSTEAQSVVNDFVIRWRMPLFFFVSGFFATFREFDYGLYKKRLSNRVFKQLYPTVVVWLIFIIYSWIIGNATFKEYFLHGIYDPAKRGYWFTSALVEVYMIYAVMTFVLFKLKINIQQQSWIFLFVAGLLVSIYTLFIRFYEPQGIILKFYNVFSIAKLCCLMPYFFLAIFCNIHIDKFFTVLRSPVFAGIMIWVYIVSSMFSNSSSQLDSAIYFLSRISGLLSVLSLFTCFSGIFNASSSIGKYLIHIGRNTLPIYLFHFFFILTIPLFVEDYVVFRDSLNKYWYIEFPLVITLSAIISEICLLADRVIKRIPYCYRCIFNPLSAT